jgi:hypothetical protein
MTSHHIRIMILVCTLSGAAYAQDPRALLVQANQSYQQGNIEAAKTT